MKMIAADSSTQLHLVKPAAARRMAVPENRQHVPELVHTTMNLTSGRGGSKSAAKVTVPKPPAAVAKPEAEAVSATQRAPRKKARVGAPRRTVAATKPRPGKKATSGKPGRKAEPEPVAREGTKKEALLALLRRPQGATLAEMTKATGWQPHSVRGYLSGVVRKAMALPLKSAKRDTGELAYSIRG